ncbi:MAG: KGG domain-containing protein [Pseudomonadota bacterium]
MASTSDKDKGSSQSSSQASKQSGSTSNRGFASMDPDRQREIASEGGKAAHEKGTAHEFTSEEARRAGSMSHGNQQSDRSSSSASKQGEQGSSKGGTTTGSTGSTDKNRK